MPLVVTLLIIGSSLLISMAAVPDPDNALRALALALGIVLTELLFLVGAGWFKSLDLRTEAQRQDEQ